MLNGFPHQSADQGAGQKTRVSAGKVDEAGATYRCCPFWVVGVIAGAHINYYLFGAEPFCGCCPEAVPVIKGSLTLGGCRGGKLNVASGPALE